MSRSIQKQESPPVWMQEAYHPPCSEYSFCCPNWVPPHPLSWPGWGVPYLGTPLAGYPQQGTPHPDLAGGTPPGYPRQGNSPSWLGGQYLGTPSRVPPWVGSPSRVPPLAGYPPPAGPGRVPPLGVCPMAFWEMLQSTMRYGYPPPRCG